MLAGNAAVMLEACLVATADLFPGAEVAALQLSVGMRPAFRRLVGVPESPQTCVTKIEVPCEAPPGANMLCPNHPGHV